MSGGELQRVRIAQARHRPDAPAVRRTLLNLDPGNARLVARLINERRRAGTAVLFVTRGESCAALPWTACSTSSTAGSESARSTT